MWKQVGLLIQICLVYMYDCMYVSWNMLVYLIFFLFCEHRWWSRKVVWKQRWRISEVKMLRNLEMLAESQEELGSYTDALSTPRVKSCTGWSQLFIYCSCSGKFPSTTVSTFWVSMTSTIKWRKYSNLFDEIFDMTDHDWHCLFWDVQEINRWKKDVLLSSSEFDSFDSAKLCETDWVSINQGLLEAQAARQLQAQRLT